MLTGVYNTSRNALGPATSAAPAVALALLATLVASSQLLDACGPAIMTTACTRTSSPPGSAWQTLVGSGSVMLEKTRTSMGYASGKLPMKRRWLPTCSNTPDGRGALTPNRAE